MALADQLLSLSTLSVNNPFISDIRYHKLGSCREDPFSPFIVTMCHMLALFVKASFDRDR